MKYTQRLFPFILIVALVALGLAGYFYYQYQKTKDLQTNPAAAQKAAEEEAKRWVAEVGKHVVLPTDEIPTVATVSDIKQLKDQPFFKHAKNGDKVILYTKAKKAYLYDPELKKVKDFGPINIGSQAVQPSQAKIAIRNGTEINGLASRAEADIQKAFPGSNIIGVGQAKRTNYEKTIVVAFNDDSRQAAETLAKFFNVSVSSFPAGETKPEGVDILVIAGKDRDRSEPISPTYSPSPTPEKR